MDSFVLNGNPVNFKYGFQVNERKNEQLDDLFVVFPQLTEKLDIEPLDEVVITYGSITKNMLVSQIQCKQITSKKQLFNYNVNLVSPVIKLQRIVLPNKNITQKINGTQKSILEKVQEFLSIYAPSLILSAEFISKTQNVECDELQWDRPTLFEVINDMLIKVNCVVTMPDFNTISLLDLTEKNQSIDMTKVSMIEYTQDVKDYASGIEIEASNVYSKRRNSSNVYPNIFRTTQQAILTSNNKEIVLQKPILNLNKVLVYLWLKYDNGNKDKHLILNITDRIVEKKVYDIKKASNQLDPTPKEDYKRFFMYYTEGSNVISGATFSEDTSFFGLVTNPSIAIIIQDILLADYGTEGIEMAYTGDFSDSEINKMLFIVGFTTSDDVKFISRKENQPKNESIIVNNQTTSQVDVFALGKQQQEVANVIGNEVTTIKGRVFTTNEIPSIGDYDGNKICYEKQVIVKKNCYDFVLKLMPDFIMKNIYAGVNRKKRYLQLADVNSSSISNHLKEVFLKFQKTDKVMSDVDKRLCKSFLDLSNENRFFFGVKTKFADGTYSNYFLLEPSKYGIGKSFVANFKMGDNYSVALQSEKDFRLLGTNVRHMVWTPYVDNFGEFEEITVEIYERGAYLNAIQDVWYSDTGNGKTGFDNAVNGVISDFPEIDYSLLDQTKLLYSNANQKRFKDNRDITAESVQFQFTTDGNVFVYDLFFEKYSSFIYDDTLRNPDGTIPSIFDLFKIAYSEDEVYNKYDKTYKGTLVDLPSGGNIEKLDNRIGIVLNNLPQGVRPVSWAICDVDGNLILAMNGDDFDRIYLVKE